MNTIESSKEITEKVDYKALAIKVWDLYYDSLAWFLFKIRMWLKFKEILDSSSKISSYILLASSNIHESWKNSKKYIDFTKPSKHSSIIRDDITNDDLAWIIANLNKKDLSNFLLLLSEKIHNDWIADESRKRLKLSKTLFDCSENLKKAWEEIGK